MANCNNPCNSCGNCHCTCSEVMGCLDIYDTACINYNGLPLPCFNVDETNVNINSLLEQAHSKVCDLIQNKGNVKLDAGDNCPKPLIDKLEAGANIILQGVGSGCNRKIRIDAILGGQAVDEKVKVSATDSVAGYLESKLVVGECMTIQKIGTGFNETLQVVIDWNCVLGKISTLAGFCNAVQQCGGGSQPQPCPTISLNSPAINGDDVTLSWISSASQFNVYVDGILLPGMPTGSNSYQVLDLANGTHTIQVSALCINGTANTATTNVVINTTCPSASALTATITGGTATLGWTAASGPNVLDQEVQYKLRNASSWTVSSTLSAGTTSHSINGLSANQIYDFRIVTRCTIGGPTPSSVYSATQITCPSMTLTPNSTSIGYSFSNVGGVVNQYVIELLDNTGTSVLQTKTENPPFATTITNTFNNLNQGTNYQIRVTVKAQEFTRTCPPQAISTSVPPSCPAPTGMSGTIN